MAAKKSTKKSSRPSLNKITKSNQRDFKKVCNEYHEFLSNSRVPFEVINTVEYFARQEMGFKKWSNRTTKKDKGFFIKNEDGTNIGLVKFGKQSISKGLHIIGAHVDSPCLNAKVNPIREHAEGVALDCYPYGGIYMHQWFDTNVNVLGHCYKKGKLITFELPGVISDATIHLSAMDRMKKTYDQAFEPESLDVFIGFKDKADFLKHMKTKHGIVEDDFARTFISVIPATTPRNLSEYYYTGFGQDDKVCSFAQMYALNKAKPEKTAIVLFFDREEIGSTGYNGALSKFLERVIDHIAKVEKVNLTEMDMRDIYENTQMISADVDVAYSTHDVQYSQEASATKFGEGLVMDRNNGGRNQYAGNNVPVTRVDMWMELFKKHNVQFKVSAIPPKVNTGGGGTIAMYFAHRGIPVTDMGIPIINMHGKNPVIFLPDLYQMVKGFEVFLNANV